MQRISYRRVAGHAEHLHDFLRVSVLCVYLFHFFCIFVASFNLKDAAKLVKFYELTSIFSQFFTNMKERLKQLIDYYGISTNLFSQKIGVSEGAIRKILTQNTTIRSDTLEKISQNFTEINMDWLITGRGEMLLKNLQEVGSSESSDNIKSLIEILNRTLIEKDKQIDRLLSIIEQGKV